MDNDKTERMAAAGLKPMQGKQQLGQAVVPKIQMKNVGGNMKLPV